MSLVQIAYNSLLTRLRDWSRLEGKERLELLQQASSLFGESFRAALNLLENSPEKLQICEYDHFYVMVSSLEKCLLFKSSSKVRLCDCTCKSSWLRKAGEKAAYLCFHQIVLELVLCIFAGRVSIAKVDCSGTAELAEYLEAIQ